MVIVDSTIYSQNHLVVDKKDDCNQLIAEIIDNFQIYSTDKFTNTKYELVNYLYMVRITPCK